MKTRKIDIYTRRTFKPHDANGVIWEYAATTEESKTCKEAKARFCHVYKLSEDQVKTSFRVE